MASTSKYIQIDPQILVEYIYEDSATSGVTGGEYETDNTGGNGIRCHVLTNDYTNTRFFFNEDSPQAGVSTGNKRTHSAVPINTDRNKYAWLTLTGALFYGDYDSNITTNANLLAQLTANPGLNAPTRTVSYDTMRIHLVNGFDFASLDYDGFIFEAQFESQNGTLNNLCSLAYLNSSNFETINPTPFLVGEKLYGKYIEIKIPSVTWLENEFYNEPPADATKGIAYQLTNASGPLKNTNVTLSLKFIGSTTTTQGQRFFNTGSATTATVPGTDAFSGLTASVEEADDGDYFLMQGLFDGINYADKIAELEQQPDTEYIVFHDIKVFEQTSQDFNLTSEFSFIQKEDFDKTFAFRPVIKNANYAISYRIEYELRLYNRADNSQVIKKSSLTRRDVKKYGKKLSRINLGLVPTISKVYNTILDQTGKAISYNNQMNLTLAVPRGDKHIVHQTQYVMGFKESVNVLASTNGITNVSGSAVRSSSATVLKFPLGKAPITITPFDDFVQFRFYLGQDLFMNLTEIGNLFLTFRDDSGTEVKIKEYQDVMANPVNRSAGECIFKIDKENSTKVTGFNTRQYFISSKKQADSTEVVNRGETESAETMLYYGTWILPGETIDDEAIRAAEAAAGITEKGQYWKFQNGNGTIYWSRTPSQFNADLAFTSMQNFKSHRIQYGWPAELDPNIIIGVPGNDNALKGLNIEKL